MSRFQRFELANNGNGWLCEHCNLYNDILTVHCRDCYFHRPLVLEQLAIQTIYRRDSAPFGENLMADKSRIELHTEFFNSGKMLYSSMPFADRREWREKLALIILEARANLSAADLVDREDSANLTPAQRELLTTNDESSNANLLNAPKIRKERMSKADKLKEQMASLGLDLSEVNKILGSVAQSQSGGSQTSSSARELKDNITFVKAEKPNPNTRESLLGDISDSIIKGIHNRPIEDLVDATRTAAHIANRLLGKFEESIEQIEEPTKTFDVNQLKFGSAD